MTLFHGTSTTFSRFQTPTGREELDVVKGGVVYFTNDVKVAKKYAGPDGYVCIAKVKDPIPYAEQRKKQGLPPKQRKYTRNVYIALPVDVEITEFKRSSEL